MYYLYSVDMKGKSKYYSVPQFAAVKGVTRDAISKLIQKGLLRENHPEVKSCNQIGRSYIIEV